MYGFDALDSRGERVPRFGVLFDGVGDLDDIGEFLLGLLLFGSAGGQREERGYGKQAYLF